jgi:hypothetical protein
VVSFRSKGPEVFRCLRCDVAQGDSFGFGQTFVVFAGAEPDLALDALLKTAITLLHGELSLLGYLVHRRVGD